MTKLVAIVALVLAGCADSTEPESTKPAAQAKTCSGRIGLVYHMRWEELTGDCGPVESSTFRTGDRVEGCTAVFESSNGDCITRGTTTCKSVDGTVVMSAFCNWAADASSGLCGVTSKAAYPDGAPACSSGYKIYYTLQR
jgi:hypothetical protein